MLNFLRQSRVQFNHPPTAVGGIPSSVTKLNHCGCECLAGANCLS